MKKALAHRSVDQENEYADLQTPEIASLSGLGS